jgi:hypothetical protein
MDVAAILFHKLIRNDGIFEAMAPVFTREHSKWNGCVVLGEHMALLRRIVRFLK